MPKQDEVIVELENEPKTGANQQGSDVDNADSEDIEGEASDVRNDGDEEHQEEGETEEDAEARRERNRKWREERKERRKEKEEGYKRELAARDRLIAEQNDRLARLERRTQGADMATLDNAIKQSADAYNFFRRQHAQAVEQANGEMAVDASEKMAIARQRQAQLVGIKNAAQRGQNQPPPLDPKLISHAQTWLGKNDWYDPNGSDDDSYIALQVDKRMAEQGWDPRTPEYWSELDNRLKKNLPHRYKLDYNSPQERGNTRPPVAGSGRESSPSGNRNTFKLSPERVQALKDSGQWNDPKLREEAVKYYRDYDKARGTN